MFSAVPDPGQPAGIAVDGESLLVTTLGLATQPVTDPRLFMFDRLTGALQGWVTIPRMMEASVMALKGVAVDAAGRAYVVDMNGRILRIDPKTGAQQIYAEFPAAVAGVATMPFDLAFDEAGVAYVTDQNLAAIWRVPAGGGAPEIWFQDPRLAGYLLGPGGIRLDLTRRYLYFTVAASAVNGNQGVVYRLPVDDPAPARLEEVLRYPARSNPFGIAFGASGKLYVALFGAHQVSVLRPDGTEERRFPSAEENARREVPYDRPVGVTFDGHGSLLVTNSAALSPPNPARMVVFDAFVDDVGAPLVRPIMPGDRSGDETPNARRSAREPALTPNSPGLRREVAPGPRPAGDPRASSTGKARGPRPEAIGGPARTDERAQEVALTTARPAPARSHDEARSRLLAVIVAVFALVAAGWRIVAIKRQVSAL